MLLQEEVPVIDLEHLVQESVRKALAAALPAMSNYNQIQSSLLVNSQSNKSKALSNDSKETVSSKSESSKDYNSKNKSTKRALELDQPGTSSMNASPKVKAPKLDHDISFESEQHEFSDCNDSDEEIEGYLDPLKNDSVCNLDHSLAGFSEIPNSQSESLKAIMLNSTSVPDYIKLYVKDIFASTNFASAFKVPKIVQQLFKGIMPQNDSILQPIMKIPKIMEPVFSDPQFDIMQDHISNDYKINNIPFAAFSPQLKRTNSFSFNLIRIRSSMLNLWNFSSIIPTLIEVMNDENFNKFLYAFFVPSLVNLFQAYQSQVFSLRNAAWPKHLISIKHRIIRAPLTKGSLWTLSQSDLKLIADLQKPQTHRSQFFRSRSFRRSFRRAGRYNSFRFRGHSQQRFNSFKAKSSNESSKN